MAEPNINLHLCDKCSDCFNNPQDLQEHIQNEHYPCTKCGKVFSTVEELQSHCDSEHPSTSQDSTGDMDVQLSSGSGIQQVGNESLHTQFPRLPDLPQTTSQRSSDDLDTKFVREQPSTLQGNIEHLDVNLPGEQRIQQGGNGNPDTQQGGNGNTDTQQGDNDNADSLLIHEPVRRSEDSSDSLDSQSSSQPSSTSEGKSKKVNKVNVNKSDNKMQKCRKCGRWFPRKYDISYHLRLHCLKKDNKVPAGAIPKHGFWCVVCKKTVDTQDDLMKHVRFHFAKMKFFRCHICSIDHKSKKSLQHHNETVHQSENVEFGSISRPLASLGNTGSKSHTVTSSSSAYDDNNGTESHSSNRPSTSTAGNTRSMDTGVTSTSNSQNDMEGNASYRPSTSSAGNASQMDVDITSPSSSQNESSGTDRNYDADSSHTPTGDNESEVRFPVSGAVLPISTRNRRIQSFDSNYDADLSCTSTEDNESETKSVEPSHPVPDDVVDSP